MARSAALFGFIVAVIAAALATGSRPTDAQDGAEATIAALQTRVAELEATVEARGEKINAQRTQIAELRGEGADPTSTPVQPDVSESLEVSGSGDGKPTLEMTAGEYAVEGRCSEVVMFAYVNDEAGEFIAFAVSRDLMNDDGPTAVDIPESGTYEIEVYCDGDWFVRFTPR